MLADQDAICVSLFSGPLLLINLAFQSPELEEVGFVEDGIMAMEWSPDGEVLALISGKGSLIVMSQDWEVLSEMPLAPDQPQSTHQFKSSKISWRGDGKYFATSHLSSDAARREVQIWDRATLSLHSTAQQLHSKGPNLPPLDPVLSWQPNGRHLFTSQRASLDPSSDSKVLLFERNGLPHGSFDLTSNGSSVKSIKWSHDSELLAILLGPPPSPAASSHSSSEGHVWSLQIWHRSNWHWYLKQERSYPASSLSCPPLFTWDQNQNLHIVSSPYYEKLGALGWGYCVSDHGTVVVVDGRDLLITPLRNSKVPPPMSAVKALLPFPAVSVSVTTARCAPEDDAQAVEGWEERLAAVLSDGSIALLRSVEDDYWEETLEEEGGDRTSLEPWTLRLDPGSLLGDDSSPSVIRQVCWIDESSLLLLVQRGPSQGPSQGQEGGGGGGGGEKGTDALVEVAIEGEWGREGGGRLRRCGALLTLVDPCGALLTLHGGGSIAFIASKASDGGGAVVQGASGQLFLHELAKGDQGGKLLPLPPSSSFPARCSQMWCLPPLPKISNLKTLLPPAIGLDTASGSLYWGSSLIASEVTSCTIRHGGAGGPALLYTTRRSLLYTVFFSQLVSGSYQHKELTASAAAAEKLLKASEREPSSNDHPDQDAAHPKPPRVPHQSQHKLGSSGITVIQRSCGNDDDMRAAMHAAMRPSEWSAAARDVVVRAVEQGSILVSAPQAEVEVVMQMPRGNLETVSPRALVLAATTRALAALDFSRAWSLATYQRLDLNIIIDFGWPTAVLPSSPSSSSSQGLSWMDLFVRQVPKASDLCDLLFSLRSENVLGEGGVYANALRLIDDKGKIPLCPSEVQLEEGKRGMGKVDLVCDALRAAVEAVPGGRELYLTVIVTCHARKEAKRLDLALSCIKEAKEGTKASSPSSLAQDSNSSQGGSAERAIKHLLLHVDPDELYRVALGMYDLPLAYMIIAHSPQKDPGEYLAELQRFAVIHDLAMRRHSINVHLRRWPEAVRDLFEAGPDHFDSALKMATEHGLIRLLLGLCTPGSSPSAASPSSQDEARRKQVLDAYGSQLELEKKFEDAAVAFLAADKPERALGAYRSAGQWRMVFVLARRLGTSKVELRRMAVQVSDELVSSGQPKEGAWVLLHHLGDVDNAVSLLADAKEWREALHLAHGREREDLVDTVVAPRAASSASTLLSDAKETREKISKYWLRLREVREKRLVMEMALAEGEEDERDDDAMTDMNSSIVSGLSIYTENTHTGDTLMTGSGSSSGRSASTLGGRKGGGPKGQKKGKAKGGKIRQGSPQEEASLVEHLTKLGPSLGQLEEGGQLCELIILLGHLDDARTLQLELSRWAAEHAAVVVDLAQHPLPPHLMESQRQQQLKVAKSKAGRQDEPQWKWSILRE